MATWSAEIKEIEKLYESFKDQIPELEKEVEQLIRFEDPNVLMLYSRRCLEVIITDLCECELKRPRKTEPLKGIIDKLNKEEKVPSHIITSMDGLNSLSTYGVHPKDFDPEQVKPTLSNLAIVIKWYLKYKGSKTAGMEESGQEKFTAKHTDIPPLVPGKSKKNLALITTSILLIVAVIVFPKIFKRDKLANLRSAGERISVAILPFQNMTNDTTWNVWQDVIQDNLINFLSNYTEELQVRQPESISSLLQSNDLTDYALITPSIARAVSQKLDADIFIYGSLSKAGNTLRINAKLIDSKTEEVFKSFQIEGSPEEGDIFPFIDSLSTEIKNFLLISELIEKESPDLQNFFASTRSLEAFSYSIQGMHAFAKNDYHSASNLFLQAVTVDSSFTFAAIMLSFSCYTQGLYEQGKMWCLKAYEKRNLMPIVLKNYINMLYATYFETLQERIKYLQQILEIDNQMPTIYFHLGNTYNFLFQYDKAIPEFEKSLEIYHQWGTKPFWSINYTALGRAYHETGKYKKEKKLYKKAEQDFPDNSGLIYRQAVLALTFKDENKTNEYIEKYISIRKDNSDPEVNITTGLAGIYSEAKIPDKAEDYYRQACLLQPENPVMMNNLAWFLIDNDRNINEGLELIDKILESNPYNYNYLHTKGWGLYKQGKYEEALEILEKSWNLKQFIDHEIYLHIEKVKKAIAGKK